jgi:hypothetical protein
MTLYVYSVTACEVSKLTGFRFTNRTRTKTIKVRQKVTPQSAEADLMRWFARFSDGDGGTAYALVSYKFLHVQPSPPVIRR